MAFRQGRFAEITVNSKSLSTYCDSIDIDRSVDMYETTTFGKTAKTYLPGPADGKLSIKGKYDPTVTTGPVDVIQAQIGATSSIFVQVYPGGSASGQQVRNFNAWVTDYKESSPLGGIVAFEASFQVDGPITASGL